MKYILVCIFMLLPASAFAMDCTSSKAIAQAKAAFADGLVNPESMQLEHVAEGTLGAIPVCQGVLEAMDQSQVVIWVNNDDGSITSFQQDDQGNITTQTLAPNGAQSQLQAVQGLGEQMAKQYAQGQAEQQKQQSQGDQAAANQIAEEWQQVKPTCDLVENHPIAAAAKAIADDKPVANVAIVRRKCQQLQAMLVQANQMEAQEGIAPSTDQGNKGNNQ